MNAVPLAYKYVAIAAMLSQINYYAPRMQLPIDVPVKAQDIRYLYVAAPIATGIFQDYGGRIQVANYSFTFGVNLHNIFNLDEHGFVSLGLPMGPQESSHSGLERASRMKYIVSTNDAYRMATNWIIGLDIDLERLEASKPPRVEQNIFRSRRGLVPSPILAVKWGDHPSGVTVVLSAVSGELLKLFDGNGAFSKRKQPLIRDLTILLAISDKEFLNYTEQERRQLVERFAGQKYSSTNVLPAIYDKLLMLRGKINPISLEKSETKSQEATTP